MSEAMAANAAPTTQTPATPGVPGQGAVRAGTEIHTDKGAPPKPGQPNQPVQPPQYYDVKVNGQVRKYTLEQLQSKAGLSDAAMQKFEEASQLAKREQMRLQKLKENPIAALLDPDLGLTEDQIRDKFEKWYHQKYIEPETLTEAEKYKRELEAYKAKEAEREQAEADRVRKEQQERLDSHTRQTVQQEIIEALDKGGLPKTRETVRKMAFYMKQNLLKGYNAPMDIVVQQVKQEMDEGLGFFLKDASVEQLISMVPDLVNKIRQHDLAQLRQKLNLSTPVKDEKSGNASSKKRVTMGDVDAYLNEFRFKK